LYGLNDQTIDEMRSAFAQCPAIEQVVLYGSRAKGNYRNGSNIDITLIGEQLTLNNSVYPLMEIFAESYLPYSFDISIFAHIDNPDLRAHIERVGKVLFVKNAG